MMVLTPDNWLMVCQSIRISASYISRSAFLRKEDWRVRVPSAKAIKLEGASIDTHRISMPHLLLGVSPEALAVRKLDI